MQNAASPGPGVYGEGGARDGYSSPILAQAVECSSLGPGVAVGHPTVKDPNVWAS